MLRVITFLLFLVALNQVGLADESPSPFGVSLVTPIQYPEKDKSVSGVRFNLIWGHHKKMTGVDLNFIGGSTSEQFVGTQIWGVAAVNLGSTEIIGLQVNWVNVNVGEHLLKGIGFSLVNYNGSLGGGGLQFALANINNALGEFYGAQVAWLNLNLSDNQSRVKKLYGVQWALVSWNQSYVGGLMVGLVNVADAVDGVQIGILNYTRTLKGLQIGLANIVSQGTIPFLPVINFGF